MFIATLNGGLIDDGNDYPGKSVEPDRRNARGGQRNVPNGSDSDGGKVAAAGGGSPGTGGAIAGSGGTGG